MKNNHQSPDWMYEAIGEILGRFDFNTAFALTSHAQDKKYYELDEFKALAKEALERAAELPDYPITIIFCGPFMAIADAEYSLSLALKTITSTVKRNDQA